MAEQCNFEMFMFLVFGGVTAINKIRGGFEYGYRAYYVITMPRRIATRFERILEKQNRRENGTQGED